MRRLFTWFIPSPKFTAAGSSYLCFLFCVLISLSHQVAAGPFEQGMESLRNGDFAEAFCLWRPLATQGNPEAAYHLGWLYANGNGLRVDIKKAIHWWTQAADQGHVDAMFALGLTYTTGEGIQSDPSKALDWYIRAAVAGHEDAREMIRTKVWTGAEEVQEQLVELAAMDWLGRPVRVKRDRVNLRSGPGTDFKPVAIVEKNAILKAIRKRNEWYQIARSKDGLELSWIAAWLTEPIKE